MTEIMPTTPENTAVIDYRARCEKCEGYLYYPDSSQLHLGQEVSFMTAKSNSNKASFSSKNGLITAISGDAVTIKSRYGDVIRDRSDVTPANAPNPLSYAFIGMCKCNKSDTGAGQ